VVAVELVLIDDANNGLHGFDHRHGFLHFSARRSPPGSRYGDSGNIGLYKVPALVQERFTSAF
jgi:hypothetical protein